MKEKSIAIEDRNQMILSVAKAWKDPAGYAPSNGQPFPHAVLIVGKDQDEKKRLIASLLTQSGLQAARPSEREFPQDFQGWVKHTVAEAMSLAAPNMMGAVALIEDLDSRLALAMSGPTGAPVKIFESEMTVPKECGLVLVTANTQTALQPLVKKGCFDRIIRV